MDETVKPHGSIWLARLCLLLGAGSIVMALIGAIGAGQDWWGKLDGVSTVAAALVVALVGLVFSLIVLLLYRKKGKRIRDLTVMGLVCSLAYLGFMGYWINVARSVPQIHDITTNLDNPPQFQVLKLRPDDFADIPGRGEPKYTGMDAKERWKVLHRGAYGDLKTVIIKLPVDRVVTLAEEVARERGWEIALAKPEEGRLEATDTVSLFKFKDDVVVRVQPGPGGLTSEVDVRSVSRVGKSDLGVNAKRIRSFLNDLQAAAPKG
ncbi:DUF1499 domain-containing protein [Blastomonas sp. UPD001]|jgi:uncharacterized protein (DUF1499 family)|uniref:DUF1499 domain-containing protein n=1 Tax=Blastomonas sp. UPD001 TaxID=2217673 RepID=UPI000E356693|nr:DUF1499 domain-containing protein [Blastomonas sp. UPD001]MBL0967086.1 DUF1499 domain-containing protein [Blastomonas sp.]